MDNYRRNEWLLLVGLVPAIAVAAFAQFALPNFVDLYQSLDVALPLISRIVFVSFRYWALFPVAVLALWFVWPDPVKRGRVVASFGLLGSLLLFVLGCWGAYQPLVFLTAS